jgi:hypothetical protein
LASALCDLFYGSVVNASPAGQPLLAHARLNVPDSELHGAQLYRFVIANRIAQLLQDSAADLAREPIYLQEGKEQALSLIGAGLNARHESDLEALALAARQ